MPALTAASACPEGTGIALALKRRARATPMPRALGGAVGHLIVFWTRWVIVPGWVRVVLVSGETGEAPARRGIA